MSAETQSVILRLGVILLGFAMLAWVMSSLRSGQTTGYYKSHVYTRNGHPLPFHAWVALRSLLALLALSGGFLLPW